MTHVVVVFTCHTPLKWHVAKAAVALSTTWRKAATKINSDRQFCGFSGYEMALTAEQVVEMLDSSHESEIDEDPE